jgi:hypothetical protein
MVLLCGRFYWCARLELLHTVHRRDTVAGFCVFFIIYDNLSPVYSGYRIVFPN